MILNGYILESHAHTTFEVQAVQPHPGIDSGNSHGFSRRELPYAEICFETECGIVIKQVESYKLAHFVDFLL